MNITFGNSVTPAKAIEQQVSTLQMRVSRGKFSEAILSSIQSPLISELKKVEFYSESGSTEYQQLLNFANEKFLSVYKWMFQKGFFAVRHDIHGWQMDKLASINTDASDNYFVTGIGEITETYQFFGKSQAKICKEFLDSIDCSLTAQKAITKILGQFTFFSQEAEDPTRGRYVQQLSDKEREKFDGKFNAIFTGNDMGSAVYFTNATLKRDTVMFDLSKLQIESNVKFFILILASVFNVPYDLIPLTGNSTFDNKEEARIYLRENTVSSIAETMLQCYRRAMKSVSPTIPKRDLNYRIITNVNSTGI